MTSILVILVLLVGGGLYVGYRAIQGNYYLASDGQQVSIYRGISQKIAFVSLSSVYRKTGVPDLARAGGPAAAHDADHAGQDAGNR